MTEETQYLLGQLAGIVSLSAFVPYIVATLRGRARPHRVSWLIWTIVSLILLLSYRAAGAETTLWVAASYAVGSGVIALLAWRYGEGGESRLDRLSLLLALASVVLWVATDMPFLALGMNLFLEYLADVPTVRKILRRPRSEDAVAWVLFAAGNTLNLFAVDRWTPAVASYPVYMFASSLVIAALVVVPSWRLAVRGA